MLSAYSLTEEELLRGLTQRNENALRVLFDTYYPVLCRFAEQFLPDAALAKDIAQETFIKLWRSDRIFDTAEALKAFLFAVTRNACLNQVRDRERLHHRHERAAVQEGPQEPEAFTSIVLAESVALVYKEVQAMPPKMQQVFLLSYRDGLAIKEIAALLHMNPKAVKKHKYKAIQLLRSRLTSSHQPLLLILPILFR